MVEGRFEAVRFFCYVAGALLLIALGFAVASIVFGFWRALPGAV